MRRLEFKKAPHEYAVAVSEDGSDIVEYDVAELLKDEVIHAKKVAIREYMKEVYAQVVADIENAAFGWLWLAALYRDRSNPVREYIVMKINYARLARIIVGVDKIVKTCTPPEEFTLQKMKYVARRFGLRTRERPLAQPKYRYVNSDLELLRDTWKIIETLHKWYYEKNCRKKEEDSAVVEKPAVEPNPQLLEQSP
jgi:hypothetical protein